MTTEAHNAARQEHLASLGLPIEGRTVLELGAGCGDHTQFFLDRGCQVMVTDGRLENVKELEKRFRESCRVWCLDVEMPFDLDFFGGNEIIYCYGLLYHTSDPIQVLRNIASLKPSLLLLETCVSFVGQFVIFEDANDPRCGLRGEGNRFPREVIWAELKRLFPFVYAPKTQPNFDEFPLSWNTPIDGECRAVFIASSEKLDNPILSTELPMAQTRC